MDSDNKRTQITFLLNILDETQPSERAIARFAHTNYCGWHEKAKLYFMDIREWFIWNMTELLELFVKAKLHDKTRCQQLRSYSHIICLDLYNYNDRHIIAYLLITWRHIR